VVCDHIPKKLRVKWDPTAKKHIFMGSVKDKIYRLYDGSRKKDKFFSFAQRSVTIPDIIETSVIPLPNLSEEISSDNEFEKLPDSNDATPTMQIVSTK
jgi:hypothetical protein